MGNSIVLAYPWDIRKGAILLWVYERATILVKINIFKHKGLNLRAEPPRKSYDTEKPAEMKKNDLYYFYRC